jgi:hypothetical protein
LKLVPGAPAKLAPVEVVVGEQAPQVLHDVVASAFDRAEGVDPVRVVRVHPEQRFRIAIVERLQQRLADRFLIRRR